MAPGRGGGRLSIENPKRGGGSPTRGGGGVSAGNFGGELNIFFRGRNAHQGLLWVVKRFMNGSLFLDDRTKKGTSAKWAVRGEPPPS